MRVFEFNQSNKPVEAGELSRQSVDTEYTLESWLHPNPSVILNEPLLIFGRQYGLETGIPDLLAVDQWGNVVIIELKKGKSGTGSASEETILSQPQNYAQSLANYQYDDLEDIYTEYKHQILNGEWEVGELAVFEDTLIDAHNHVFSGGIDHSQVNEYQRMVILAENITPRTESNARYLLKQGLNIQCVEVQWFALPAISDSSLLVSSTVVDYPLSRVRPKRASADFSDLTQAVRGRVAAHLEDTDGIAEVRATSTQVRVRPSYLENLRIEVFVPGNEAGTRAEPRINAQEVEREEDVGRLRAALSNNLSEHGMYEVDKESVMNLVHRKERLNISKSEVDAIEELTEELVNLMEKIHPVLLEEFRENV